MSSENGGFSSDVETSQTYRSTRDDELTLGGSNTINTVTSVEGDTQPTDKMGSSPAVEDEGGEDNVVVALPPSDSDGVDAYQEIALSGSAALDLLDQLVANNALGKEKAAKLRRKYNSLRETLESSREVESKLLEEAKALGHKLTYQKRVLERTAAFPEGSNTQAGNLRQLLLTHQNELDMSEARLDKQQNETEMLEMEYSSLEKEYHRLPKKEELEQHIKELSKTVEELNDEISLRSQDVQRYHNDLERKNFRITVTQQEIQELREGKEALQQELIDLRTGPNISKESEVIKRQHKETQRKIKELEKLLEELTLQFTEAEKRNYKAGAECSELASRLQSERSLQMEKEVGIDQLNKYIYMGKEREANHLEERATLEIRERHRVVEARALHEALSSKSKEKDRELKSLRKAELQLSLFKQSREQIAKQAEFVEERKIKQTADAQAIRSAKEQVTKEVGILRKGVNRMEGVTVADQEMLNRKLSNEEAMKKSVKRHQSKMYELHKDIITMTKARDQESRLYYQTMKEYKAIKSDIKSKDGAMQEQQKRIRELEAELMDFMAAYEAVKAERNKTHSQILVLKQIGAEMTEKSKILGNEMDILRSNLSERDKIIQKCSTVYSAKVLERDTQRMELSKLIQTQNEVGSQLDCQREEIHKLTHQISVTEQQLNRLRRRYEQTVQDRNDLGLQLIERNEEVCVFYEKQNVQESVLREANLKLTAREEELKFLNMELKKIQNDILISRKKLPDKDKTEEELVNAQIELKTCEQHLRILEKRVEDASDPNRLRLLPGENPSLKELDEKLDKVEGQLAECEQQLLEKELLYEQIGKLTERANKRVDGQRSSTLTVAKKVNHYQAKIKDLTRKMMALVSELSMQQASALHLQQEAKEKEIELQRAYSNLENGEAPDDQTLAQLEKMFVIEHRKKQEELNKKMMAQEDEAYTLSGGTVTTAEPRPNAYIPSGDGELPVPKPYGGQAPFKPTEPGANMRHIRRPQPQPIDI